MFAAHVSEEGNVISILQAGEIIRSVLLDTDNVGFFCQAFELTNHEDHDAAEAARALFNASNMSKNRSGLVLTIKAYGQGQKVSAEANPRQMTIFCAVSAGLYIRATRASRGLRGKPTANCHSASND